jgi:PAS domain S-box-containing protein
VSVHSETAPVWLDTLFEEAPFGIAWFDADLRFRRVNRRLVAMNGLSAEAHIGRTIAEVVKTDRALDSQIVRAMDRREPVSLEASGETLARPGEARRWLVSFHPVEDGGELAGVLAFALEVTGEDTREEELARLIELERAARSRAEAAEARAEFLTEATASLDASLDLRTTLRTLSRIVVPTLADLCLVDMLEDGGEHVRRLAVAHRDPAVESEVWELTRRWPSAPGGVQGIRHVIASGKTQYFRTISEDALAVSFPDPEHRERVSALGLRSAVVAPLRARGRTFGSITFVQAGSDRTFSPADVALAEELCRRAALAVDNARLYTDLRRADRAQRFLSEASQLLAASLDYETTLETVAQLATAGVADGCSVDVVDQAGMLRSVALSHVDPEKLQIIAEARRRWPTPVAKSLYIGESHRRTEPVLVREMGEREWAELARDEEHLAVLRKVGVRSIVVVPMIARDRMLGTIALFLTDGARRFGEEDQALAEELGRRAAVAADNARLYSDRSRVARTLQRSLMPAELPSIPHIDTAVRFRSAGDGGEVGGDFYDVFDSHRDGWIAVVGDVCGKGAEAATLTSLSRHTLRAAARYETGPVGMLTALNEAILAQSPELLFTTAALMAVENGEDHTVARIALGGHLPPLLVRADGTVEPLSARGSLLGVFPGPELEETRAELHDGDAVVLYTDGVTEAGAPDQPLGEEALAGLLRGVAGKPAAEIARAVEEQVAAIEPGLPRDDMAVLVLRRV